ncbi:MAG: YigZ family protein [Oscillospiraceae bacterium]|nr:YigZ family protein [Oscillospiraceae bacterium]MBQ3049236.1 YigZ family protein [Oscillospiraceae bacterium]MBQ9939907.1 YigZ family protein [Oscillospiraceae bacterium]
MGDYKTVADFYSDEFVEKRSRFIGYIAPAQTPEEATAFINEIKAKHWDATHNVYAYILREGQLSRYSDDGEPQGTAGMPVLGVLQKSGLTDVVVVVTRYFGGILLGGGGLVRAYSHGAAIAVEGAEILNMRLCKVFTVDSDYTLYGKISRMLPRFNIQQQNIEFGASVVLTLAALPDDYDAFTRELTEISAGGIVPQLIEETYLNKN